MSGYEAIELINLIPPSIKDIGLAVFILSIVEIAPVKVNPWQWLRSFAELPKRLESLEHEFNDDRAFRWRTLIFNRARLIEASISGKGELLRREEWEETLKTMTNYKQYCKDNPKFENDQATETMAFISNSYKFALEHNLFL